MIRRNINYFDNNVLVFVLCLRSETIDDSNQIVRLLSYLSYTIVLGKQLIICLLSNVSGTV